MATASAETCGMTQGETTSRRRVDESPILNDPVPNGRHHAPPEEPRGVDNQSVNLGGDPCDDPQDILASLGLSEAEGTAASLDQTSLHRENLELREIIAELKQQIDQQVPLVDPNSANRQREFDALIEEKTEIIRELHLKIQQLQDGRSISGGGQKEDELLALSEELDRERCQLQKDIKELEVERAQLKEDEQQMTKQLRDMEVQMARERADFARQRVELTRIYEEIRREMENIERNGLLNQRLGQLRQRLHETGAAVGVGTRTGSSPAMPATKNVPDPNTDHRESEPPKRRESIIGRFFG